LLYSIGTYVHAKEFQYRTAFNILNTSDLEWKQRKEVLEGGRSSAYRHQAPVRAALRGRLLVFDGLEKAERNILPILNNLFENREMSLDDGSMLVSAKVFDQPQHLPSSVKMHRVHPDFCVAALGSMHATLDPPLRSCFQARLQRPLDPAELLQALATTS
jgi:hypothetical protein